MACCVCVFLCLTRFFLIGFWYTHSHIQPKSENAKIFIWIQCCLLFTVLYCCGSACSIANSWFRAFYLFRLIRSVNVTFFVHTKFAFSQHTIIINPLFIINTMVWRVKTAETVICFFLVLFVYVFLYMCMCYCAYISNESWISYKYGWRKKQSNNEEATLGAATKYEYRHKGDEEKLTVGTTTE